MRPWKSLRDLADAERVVERRRPHGPVRSWGDETSTFAELPSGVVVAVDLNAAMGVDADQRAHVASGLTVTIDGVYAATLTRGGDGPGREDRALTVHAADPRLPDGARLISMGWTRGYADASIVLESAGAVMVGPHRGWLVGALRPLKVADGTPPETVAMYLAASRGARPVIT